MVPAGGGFDGGFTQKPEWRQQENADHLIAARRKPDRRTPLPESRANVRSARAVQNTILVIDDDRDTCNAICAVLEAAGFSTAMAANGREGLALLAGLDPRPSLVLLDLWMPEMNGWDFHEHMSRDREFRSIPIIIMTAYGRKDGSGSLKWLTKPIDSETLLEAVHASFAAAAKR
jgi:two-component system, chemotaxis family, chemotaxis protein CheY